MQGSELLTQKSSLQRENYFMENALPIRRQLREIPPEIHLHTIKPMGETLGTCQSFGELQTRSPPAPIKPLHSMAMDFSSTSQLLQEIPTKSPPAIIKSSTPKLRQKYCRYFEEIEEKERQVIERCRWTNQTIDKDLPKWEDDVQKARRINTDLLEQHGVESVSALSRFIPLARKKGVDPFDSSRNPQGESKGETREI